MVYLCEHNENGAGSGDQQADFDDAGGLFEKVGLTPPDDERAAGPVFYGGPVQTDRGFVLHEPLDASGGHYNATLSVPVGWR